MMNLIKWEQFNSSEYLKKNIETYECIGKGIDSIVISLAKRYY